MNGMLEALGKIVGDSLATLNGVSIYGMASADGSYALNDRLAKNRAGSARDWLVQNLHLSAQDARHFSVGARPEGWRRCWKPCGPTGIPTPRRWQKS